MQLHIPLLAPHSRNPVSFGMLFSFSFPSKNFLILHVNSSLTHWLFRSAVSFHTFVISPPFLLILLISFHCGWRIKFDFNSLKVTETCLVGLHYYSSLFLPSYFVIETGVLKPPTIIVYFSQLFASCISGLCY